MGIVNGTTNFILTRMTEEGASYAEALAEAQSARLRRARSHRRRRGLRRRGEGGDHRLDRVRRRASWPATSTTRASAASPPPTSRSRSRLGYVIKLLAVVERSGRRREIGVRVHPAMVPVEPPAGQRPRQLQRGVRRGRGRRRPHVLRPRRRRPPDRVARCSATSSTRRPTSARARSATIGTLAEARIRPIDEAHVEYYLNLEVADRPGVLAAVAGVFGRHGVSIRSMEQEGLGDEARLIFITHIGARGRRAGDAARPARARCRRRVGTLLRS